MLYVLATVTTVAVRVQQWTKPNPWLHGTRIHSWETNSKCECARSWWVLQRKGQEVAKESLFLQRMFRQSPSNGKERGATWTNHVGVKVEHPRYRAGWDEESKREKLWRWEGCSHGAWPALGRTLAFTLMIWEPLEDCEQGIIMMWLWEDCSDCYVDTILRHAKTRAESKSVDRWDKFPSLGWQWLGPACRRWRC